MIPSLESIRVLTRARRLVRQTVFQEGIFPSHYGFPLAQFFIHQSELEFDSPQLVLCSLGAEVRETGTARRFRFMNWNFHGFKFPFVPVFFSPNLDTIPP
jgi:hypothetical protein